MPLVVLLVVVPALAAAGAAAPWTQAGFDAARTGAVPFEGPVINDTAFHVRLPGFFTVNMAMDPAGPLVFDGAAYVPVWANEDWRDAEGRTPVVDGVARVDLATAEVEPVVVQEDGRRVATIATDGTHLFVATDAALEAYRLSEWERAWTWQYPRLWPEAAGSDTEGCSQPAVTDGTVILSCTQGEFDEDGPIHLAGFVVAVDAASGAERWLWTTQDGEQEVMAQDPEARATLLAGVAVAGDRVFVSSFSLTGFAFVPCDPADAGLPCEWAVAAHGSMNLYALDAADGAYLWRHKEDGMFGEARYGGETHSLFETFLGLSARPAATDRVVYMRMSDRVLALNAGTGQVLWSEVIGKEDVSPENQFAMSGFAVGGPTLYTASLGTLYRYDTDSDPPVNRWQMALSDPAPSERFGDGDLVLAGDTLYAATRWNLRNETGWYHEGTTLLAVDADQGDERWRRTLRLDPGWGGGLYQSLGEGVLAVAGAGTNFWVLGRTNASLDPVASVSNPIPPPGQEVHVDLSGTGPGVHGPATWFRAEWGDGTTTPWQADPVLSHVYNRTGEATARFVVANDANQTASTTHTFHVGGEAPARLNPLQVAFARENQDMTFGVLGIALAATGGAVGLVQRRRKRARLQDELEALEAGFDATKDNPGECEAFLDTRKARARSLLMDGELTEEQFGVVERRVQDLHKELRTTVLDARFQFLPHGMVQSVKKMLADGRLSAWERDALDDLLDREEALSEAQKDRVRGQLDRWFAEDRGVDAG